MNPPWSDKRAFKPRGFAESLNKKNSIATHCRHFYFWEEQAAILYANAKGLIQSGEI